MNSICPLISNHEEFLECQENNCKLWNTKKNNCSFAIISKNINDISYDTNKIEKDIN